MVNSLSVHAAVLFHHEEHLGSDLTAFPLFRLLHTVDLGNEKTGFIGFPEHLNEIFFSNQLSVVRIGYIGHAIG